MRTHVSFDARAAVRRAGRGGSNRIIAIATVDEPLANDANGSPAFGRTMSPWSGKPTWVRKVLIGVPGTATKWAKLVSSIAMASWITQP